MPNLSVIACGRLERVGHRLGRSRRGQGQGLRDARRGGGHLARRTLPLHARLALHLGREMRSHPAEILRGERGHVLASEVVRHTHARHLHHALHLEL
eukprot:scaffold97875_cov36-Phaeocystis_antarctica.AAC.1